MFCEHPKSFSGQVVGCGQCLPCRFNKRREWTHRICLEALQWEDNAFINLSYSDEHLPRIAPADVAELRPRHLQLFLKRLRWSHHAWQLANRVNDVQRLRFFAVGEYGDETWRPHYHAAVFNFPTCARGGITRADLHSRGRSCCLPCDMVRDAWGLGAVVLGSLEISSAQYVAGYVTKKLTRRDDLRLEGRHPEFARMSNRPGIGVGFMHDVASEFLALNLATRESDVPVTLALGGRSFPLGRHLRKKLRQMIGISDGKAPFASHLQRSKELQLLQEAAVASTRAGAFTTVSELIAKLAEGKAARLKARERIFKKRGDLS